MANRDEIVQQALALPPDDRAYVVDVLEQSLIEGDFASPEIAAAWMEEIERRASAYERGEMPAEDWRTVMGRLRSQEVSSPRNA